MSTFGQSSNSGASEYSPEQVRELLALFFGTEVSSAYVSELPESILALPDGEREPAAVMAAFTEALAVIASSPLASSPQAAAMQSILKSVASSLLLGTGSARPLRAAEIAAQRRSTQGDLHAGPSSPPAIPQASALAPTLATPPPPRPQPASVPTPHNARTTPLDELQNRAMLLIAQRGRVDVDVLRELQAVALQLRLPVAAASQAVATIVRQSASPAQSVQQHGLHRSPVAASSPAPLPAQREDESDPASRMLRRLMIGAAAFVCLCIALLAGSLVLSKRGGPAAASPAAAADPADSAAALAGGAAAQTGAPTGGPAKVVAAPTPIDMRAIVPSREDAQAAIRELARLAATPTGQVNATELTAVLTAYCRTWPALATSGRRAGVEAAVDAFLRTTPEVQTATLAELLPLAKVGSQQPLSPAGLVQSAGAAGLLARVSRERELVAKVRQSLRELGMMAQTPELQAFDPAATSALRSTPLRLVASKPASGELTAAFDAFTLAASALSGSSPADLGASQPAASSPTDLPAQREIVATPGLVTPQSASSDSAVFGGQAETIAPGRSVAEREAASAFLLDALEQLLRGGPDPLTDKTMHLALSDLGQRITWSGASGSRSKLIAWFDDQSVPTVRLSIITAALCRHSGAEGVDLTMALSSAADRTARDLLRGRYSEAWNLAPMAPLAGRQDWLSRLQRLADAADSDASRLFVTAAAADVNRYFYGTLIGGAAASEPVIPDAIVANVAGLSTGAANLSGPIATIRNQPSDSQGGLALRYFSERTITARLQVVREFDTLSGPLDAIEADALVDAAIFGNSAELRAIALRVLVKRSDEALILTSLLELIPRMSRSRSNADAISLIARRSVPSPESPDYPGAIRRACVERFLEIVATSTPLADVDGQVSRLADAYRATATLFSPVVAAPSADGASTNLAFIGRAPAESAQQIYARLRARVVLQSPPASFPLQIQHIDRTSAARAAASGNVVRSFAAWQLSLLEVTALTCASDRPAAAPAIAQLLTQTRTRRDQSAGIAQQIMHTELTITKVWLIWESFQ